LGKNLDLRLELGEAQIRVFKVVHKMMKETGKPLPPHFIELADRVGVKI
jgi:hypothetical protein